MNTPSKKHCLGGICPPMSALPTLRGQAKTWAATIFPYSLLFTPLKKMDDRFNWQVHNQGILGHQNVNSPGHGQSVSPQDLRSVSRTINTRRTYVEKKWCSILAHQCQSTRYRRGARYLYFRLYHLPSRQQSSGYHP